MDYQRAASSPSELLLTCQFLVPVKKNRYIYLKEFEKSPTQRFTPLNGHTGWSRAKPKPGTETRSDSPMCMAGGPGAWATLCHFPQAHSLGTESEAELPVSPWEAAVTAAASTPLYHNAGSLWCP